MVSQVHRDWTSVSAHYCEQAVLVSQPNPIHIITIAFTNGFDQQGWRHLWYVYITTSKEDKVVFFWVYDTN